MSTFKSFDIRNFGDIDPQASNHWKINCNNSDSTIENLNQVNIFCGENNSGKSRFLRLLHQSWHVAFSWSSVSATIFQSHFSQLDTEIKQLQDLLQFRSFSLTAEFYKHTKLQDLKNILSNQWLRRDSIRDAKSLITEVDHNLTTNKQQIITFLDQELYRRQLSNIGINKWNRIFDLASDLLNKFIQIANLDVIPSESTYIPIIRSIIPLSATSNHTDIIIQNQYSVNNVFSGQTIGERISAQLNSSAKSRQKLIEYEKYLSQLFFDGREVFLSPHNSSVKVKIDGFEERELHHFGDGVTSIIILTFDAFFAESPKVYFIEEPEVYLHPALQRRFLDIITGKFPPFSEVFKRHQWFFTTHSNHFLDLTLEHNSISVFNFTTGDGNHEPVKIIEPVYLNTWVGKKNVLDSLGVQASSVFRSNKIVWVEGISDIVILRTFLKNYLNENRIHLSELKEEIYFTFVFYSGANLPHFNFSSVEVYPSVNISSICHENFVILDGDVRNKGTRLADLMHDIGSQNTLIMDCKEIENLLSEEVLKHWLSVKIEKSKSLKAQKKIEYIQNNLSSISSVAYETSSSSVGAYLDSLFGTTYFLYENTIRDKQELAGVVNDFQGLTYNSSGRVLTKKLLEFISPSIASRTK